MCFLSLIYQTFSMFIKLVFIAKYEYGCNFKIYFIKLIYSLFDHYFITMKRKMNFIKFT